VLFFKALEEKKSSRRHAFICCIKKELLLICKARFLTIAELLLLDLAG
jgi:hypothetical protein